MAARFCPGLGSGPVLLHTVLPGATSPGEQLVFFRVPQILVSHLKTKPNLDTIVKPYFFFLMSQLGLTIRALSFVLSRKISVLEL